MHQYDAIWSGAAHKNFCVAITDGKATVKVEGTPDFQLYFARNRATSRGSTRLFAQGLETPGKIDIDTPDDRHANGDVCLGVAR